MAEFPLPFPASNSPARRLPRELIAYLLLVALLWALSLVPALTRRLWDAAPIWFQPPFFDFGCYFDRVKFIRTPAFWTVPGPTWNYPAPSIFVYQFFYLFNRTTPGPHQVFRGYLAYLIFVGGALLWMAALLARELARHGWPLRGTQLTIGLSVILCWPLYFGLERGNIEIFAGVGLAAGAFCLLSGRWWWAAVVLGLFAALKLTPVTLLACFLPARRWKELGLALLTLASISWAGVRAIGPAPSHASALADSQGGAGVLHGILQWVREYSIQANPKGAPYDHSLFGLLKFLARNHPDSFGTLLLIYLVVAAAGVTALFLFRLVRLPLLNQVLATSVVSVLLAPTSFDYTLILLVPTWAALALLLAREPADRPPPGLRAALLCLALLLAPELFLRWDGMWVNGQFKAVVLLVLLTVAAWYPLEAKV